MPNSQIRADFMQSSDFQHVLEYKPPSWSALKKIQKARAESDGSIETHESSFLAFTESEQEELRRLQNRKCKSLNPLFICPY